MTRALARSGLARQATQGMVRQFEVWHGLARLDSLGVAWTGLAGKARTVGEAQGLEGRGNAGNAGHGRAGFGLDRRGLAWQDKANRARHSGDGPFA